MRSSRALSESMIPDTTASTRINLESAWIREARHCCAAPLRGPGAAAHLMILPYAICAAIARPPLPPVYWQHK